MTPKQQRFIEEYLVDLNAKHAAIRAGYSPATAEQQGYQLLQHPSVSAAIEEAKQKRSEATGLTAQWVLEQAGNLYAECRREGDRTNAKNTLDLIGKHISVQAFKELRELTGTLNIGAALDSLDP